MTITKYKDITPETFVKVYFNKKQIYAGLQSMNPLKNLKFEFNKTLGYFECSHASKKYKLLVI